MVCIQAKLLRRFYGALEALPKRRKSDAKFFRVSYQNFARGPLYTHMVIASRTFYKVTHTY